MKSQYRAELHHFHFEERKWTPVPRTHHALIPPAIFGFVDTRWPAEWKIHIKMEKNRRGRMYFNVTGKNGSHPRNARWFIRSLHLLPPHEPTDAFLAFSRFSFSFIYTHIYITRCFSGKTYIKIRLCVYLFVCVCRKKIFRAEGKPFVPLKRARKTLYLCIRIITSPWVQYIYFYTFLNIIIVAKRCDD